MLRQTNESRRNMGDLDVRESNALKLLTLAARAGQDDAERPLPDPHNRGGSTRKGYTHSLAASSNHSDDPSILGSDWSYRDPKDNEEKVDNLFTSSSSELKNQIGLSNLRIEDSPSNAEEDVGNMLQSTNSERGRGAAATQRSHSLLVEEAGPSNPLKRVHSAGADSKFSTDENESEDRWSTSSNDSNEQGRCHPTPGEIIGRGAFGSVYKTIWKGQPAALKVLEHDDELGQSEDECADLDLDDASGDLEGKHPSGGNPQAGGSNSMTGTATQADLALMEAAMCSAVHHPNVVQTFHYRTLQPSHDSGNGLGRAVRETHIVMEFCDCGSLEDATTDGRLADSSGADVDLELLCMTLLEVCRAMEYLHKMHITHRDLKLANVLLKSDPDDIRRFTTKVSDFGLSRLLPDHSPKLGSNAEYTGTITHMAPELLEHGGMSRAADVYSFGVLMWEALMGEPAYQGISKMQVMFGVVSEGLRPVFPANTPPWYSQIADACWRQEPKRRPTFTRVAQLLEESLCLLRSH